MTNIQNAKAMLPNMPAEVFDAWLRPIIEYHNCWPYSTILSRHPSRQWSQYFAFFTMSEISNCLWAKMTLTFDMGCLDHKSDETLRILIEKHVYDIEPTVTFNVRDSKERFFGFVEFIKKTGSIPPPIIGINTTEGLRILDGSHRLAALTYLGLRGHIQCDTWIGHPHF